MYCNHEHIVTYVQLFSREVYDLHTCMIPRNASNYASSVQKVTKAPDAIVARITSVWKEGLSWQPSLV